MKIAKIGDLKNNLSRYLGYVRRGETILVLDRDEAIAEIIPRKMGREGMTAKLRRLEKAGRIRIGPNFGKPLPKSWFTEPLPGKGAGVLAALLEDRREGR